VIGVAMFGAGNVFGVWLTTGTTGACRVMEGRGLVIETGAGMRGEGESSG
jgi:hypothetical protein